MSKQAASVAVTLLFNIVVAVAPNISEANKKIAFYYTVPLLILAWIWWLWAHFRKPKRGPEPQQNVSAKSVSGSNIASAGRDVHQNIYQSRQPLAAAEQPYIYAKLAIEFVDENRAKLRAEIENGKLLVENVRITCETKGFSRVEYDTLIARMIAPHGKISALISPIPEELSGAYQSVVVTIYFDAKSDGINKHFVATHRFLVEPGISGSRIIDPESSNYVEGKLDARSKRSKILSQFAQTEGTIFLVLPERNQAGDWNYSVYQNQHRRFEFNPEIRSVCFETATLSGRIARVYFSSLGEPKQSNVKGLHQVTIMWDQHSALLSVDGIDVRDCDEAHR